LVERPDELRWISELKLFPVELVEVVALDSRRDG
jgi:hypothetical protein